MPFVRISLLRGKPPAYLRALSDAVHQALVAAFAIPPADRFHAIHQHAPEELVFDRDYLGGPRSDDFVLVCVTGGRERDAAAKHALYRRLAELLAHCPGLRPQDLMVIVQTTAADDWSFSDGLPATLAMKGNTP